MTPASNRYLATIIIFVILFAVLFGVYYVQTTMGRIESARPVQVVNEKTALTTLTQNLGYLANSISDLKVSPYSKITRQNVFDDLGETQRQLKYLRDTYRFKNQLGATAIHAVIYPALFDIKNWLTNGVQDLPVTADIVLDLLELRSHEALEQSKKLENAANQLAVNMMSSQSENISSFRNIATFGLVAFVLLTGWLVVMIWRQFATTEQLLNSEYRFRDFANITSDFLWETDKDLRTTFLSEKFESLTGLNATATIGQIMHPSLFDTHVSEGDEAEFRRAFESGQTVRGITLQLASSSGADKFLQIDAKPILGRQGELSGYRGGMKDVTELTHALRTAEEMKALAETASQAKTNFLANMSHEIRSPIAIITGMTDLLLDSSRDPGSAKFLRTIKDSSESLLSLINRILDVSKIESEKMPLSHVSFDVLEMAESIRFAYAQIVKAKNITVSLEVDPDIETERTGDKFRIEQVLRNLVDNAAKFTEAGAIRIRINSHPEANKLQFSVSDTGVGIPLKKQQEMFEPFMQADDSISRKYGGTGLGLAICKQLVERMGGELWMESQLGKGSRFTFTITFQADTDEHQVEHISVPDKSAIQNKLNILLAEDDPIMAMIFKESLRALDHHISVAENGTEAVAMFNNEKFDIVFMDIHMPEMDGYAAVAEMRKATHSEHNEYIPIVALSASVLSSDVDRCLQSGFTRHISKPFNKESLLNCIDEFT